MDSLTIVGNVYAPPASDLPNVTNYCFVVKKNGFGPQIAVHQGQYVGCFSDEGFVIGIINEIVSQNKYYSDPSTLKELAAKNLNIEQFIPAKNWDLILAFVSVQSFIPNILSEKEIQELYKKDWFHTIKSPTYPVKPGTSVYLIEKEIISYLLGIDSKDIHIGKLENYDNDVFLDINRLFNKHVAILAQSGAGKSYTVSVLIEELLRRESETPALLLIDTHSEYKFFSDKDPNSPNASFSKKTKYINGNFMHIGVPHLTEYDFIKFQPNITNPQIRKLRAAIWECKKKFKKQNGYPEYGLQELITEILADEENNKVSENLAAWLEDLARLQLFSNADSPILGNILRTGHLTLIDLGNMISERKKQILLSYILTRLFTMRRNETVPPFIVFLEEAHNYCPENASKETAIARSIIETISREGRKFFAQLVLISQRPVKLSTTILAQCNTQIIMRVTNPYDINHIKQSSEHLTDIANKINILPTGHALLVGAAVNYPVFVKIKQRTCKNTFGERTLKEMCQNFEAKEQFEGRWDSEPEIPKEASEMENREKPHPIVGTQEEFVVEDEFEKEAFEDLDKVEELNED